MTDFAKARRTMVDNQVRPFDVTDHAVIAALGAVERERFVPDAARAIAYLDRPVAIAPGRTMLTPMVFARMVQALAPTRSERVLDVGCGLGYSTAVLAALAGDATGLESDAALSADAAARLAGAGIANASVATGPLDRAPAGDGPFDAIFVNGAVDSIPPGWIAALRDGGRLAFVRGPGRSGRAVLATKIGSAMSERILFDAAAPTLLELADKPAFAF